MRWLKNLVLFAGLALTLGNEASGQLFAGYNAGPILGRTLDAGLLYYPKNEDWIAVAFSGGYTFQGPMYFARREAECLKQFKNGGWHMRLGLRNGLTTDHHSNHPWWGLDLIYSPPKRKRQNQYLRCRNGTAHDGLPKCQCHERGAQSRLYLESTARKDYFSAFCRGFWTANWPFLLGARPCLANVTCFWRRFVGSLFARCGFGADRRIPLGIASQPLRLPQARTVKRFK
ncbi:MAG: hypothetical protein IPP17_30270 [Bacteroidetes bacterium]|nr:hypothetical protein [Bacteroidota bacterium]